jgi:signal transduction histidine kinase
MMHQNTIERIRSDGRSEATGALIEMAGLRKGGSEFPVEVSYSVWRTGEGIFFTNIIRDITGRKRAEEALQEQTRELAALEERQRLARDLHDAVSQTLFSASLSAEVLPRLWESDQAEARRCLEELHYLTRSALAEMRTLLLEVRPGALAETALNDLLSQLAEAVGRRAQLAVSLYAEQVGQLPPDVQVALYRIAQEALNNVVKHADASRTEVRLRRVPPAGSNCSNEQSEGLELCISDDGRGFNPDDTSLQHLGLCIMRERAEAIAADLKITSRPGHGTQVLVTWP